MRKLKISLFIILLSGTAFGVPNGGAGIQGDTQPSNHTTFAEGYISGGVQNVDLSAAGINIWVEVDGCTSGDLKSWTHAACDFTAVAGLPETEYLVIWNITFKGSANDDYQGGISVNNVMDPGCRAAREGSIVSYYSNIGGVCIVDIIAGDIIKPEMRVINDNTDANVYFLTITIYQL